MPIQFASMLRRGLLSNTGRHQTSDPSRPAFATLPSEIKAQIVREDPDASFALIATCREMESVIFEGVLRPLFHRFSDCTIQMRAFLSEALRAGKTPSQVVALSDTLADLDLQSLGSRLVAMGMFTPRGNNALSTEFLQLFCSADLLVYAFGRRFPILPDNDLADPSDLMGIPPKPTASPRTVVLLGRDVYLCELNKVLLRFARQLGEQCLIDCAAAQFVKKLRFSRPLTYTTQTLVERKKEEERARLDTVTLAYMLKRYLSATTLRVVDHNPDQPAGDLHEAAFAQPLRTFRPLFAPAPAKTGPAPCILV